MRRVSVVELRQELAEILNRAEYKGERFIVHRRDKEAAAIISIDDLRLFEQLLKAEEDRTDLAAVQSARSEGEPPVPYEQIRGEFRLTHEPGPRISHRNPTRRRAPARRNTEKGSRPH